MNRGVGLMRAIGAWILPTALVLGGAACQDTGKGDDFAVDITELADVATTEAEAVVTGDDLPAEAPDDLPAEAPDDLPTDAPPDCGQLPRAPRCPCDTNADCANGLCGTTSSGGACLAICELAQACSSDEICVNVSIGEPLYACVAVLGTATSAPLAPFAAGCELSPQFGAARPGGGYVVGGLSCGKAFLAWLDAALAVQASWRDDRQWTSPVFSALTDGGVALGTRWNLEAPAGAVSRHTALRRFGPDGALTWTVPYEGAGVEAVTGTAEGDVLALRWQGDPQFPPVPRLLSRHAAADGAATGEVPVDLGPDHRVAQMIPDPAGGVVVGLNDTMGMIALDPAGAPRWKWPNPPLPESGRAAALVRGPDGGFWIAGNRMMSVEGTEAMVVKVDQAGAYRLAETYSLPIPTECCPEFRISAEFVVPDPNGGAMAVLRPGDTSDSHLRLHWYTALGHGTAFEVPAGLDFRPFAVFAGPDTAKSVTMLTLVWSGSAPEARLQVRVMPLRPWVW